MTFSLIVLFSLGKKFSGNKGPRNGTSSAVAQLSGRNSLLSVEPLKSIIETEDNERYIEGQDHDEISQLVNSMSHVSVDDIMLDDADENYDTDLEEDFPGMIMIERLVLECNN